MPYLVTDARIVFPDKRPSSSFASGYGTKKPKAHIECELEGGFERQIWIPVRVARAYVKDVPTFPLAWDEFKTMIEALENKCALVLVTEMLSRRDHAIGEIKDKLSVYGFDQRAIDYATARAIDLHFLDEQRFCRYFIEERKRRGWGRRKIETELKRRHVNLDEIAGYPEAFFQPEDDLVRAKELLAKRRIPEDRAFEKLVRFLMGKGFSYRIAADATKERIDSICESSW